MFIFIVLNEVAYMLILYYNYTKKGKGGDVALNTEMKNAVNSAGESSYWSFIVG